MNPFTAPTPPLPPLPPKQRFFTVPTIVACFLIVAVIGYFIVLQKANQQATAAGHLDDSGNMIIDFQCQLVVGVAQVMPADATKEAEQLVETINSPPEARAV